MIPVGMFNLQLCTGTRPNIPDILSDIIRRNTHWIFLDGYQKKQNSERQNITVWTVSFQSVIQDYSEIRVRRIIQVGLSDVGSTNNLPDENINSSCITRVCLNRIHVLSNFT
jgi:hypothetical protein